MLFAIQMRMCEGRSVVDYGFGGDHVGESRSNRSIHMCLPCLELLDSCSLETALNTQSMIWLSLITCSDQSAPLVVVCLSLAVTSSKLEVCTTWTC